MEDDDFNLEAHKKEIGNDEQKARIAYTMTDALHEVYKALGSKARLISETEIDDALLMRMTPGFGRRLVLRAYHNGVAKWQLAIAFAIFCSCFLFFLVMSVTLVYFPTMADVYTTVHAEWWLFPLMFASAVVALLLVNIVDNHDWEMYKMWPHSYSLTREIQDNIDPDKERVQLRSVVRICRVGDVRYGTLTVTVGDESREFCFRQE